LINSDLFGILQLLTYTSLAGPDEVVEDVEAVDGAEGVSQQLVAFLFLAVELVDHFEVDVLVVELGDQAANQNQSLLSAEPIVLWVLYRSHQHSVESLVVPLLYPPHYLLQGFDLSLVFLLSAGLEVGEHEQSDGDFEMRGLGAVTAEGVL
jgi:hypothetical protein